MKQYFAIAAAVLITVQSAFAETGTELIDKMIAAPGSYSQVCDILITTRDVPLKPFQIQDYSGAYFSDKNLALMKSRRGEVVAAVRKRLGEIDLSREPVTPGPDPNADEKTAESEIYGGDPMALSSFLLEIIKKTSATETLPELLALESKMVAAIAAAREGKEPPEVYGWFAVMVDIDHKDLESWKMPVEGEPRPKASQTGKLNRSRAAQRDLVTLMAYLMREQKYEPYLATDFEKAYVNGLKKQAKEFDLNSPGKANDASVKTDPISGVRYREYEEIAIPYTRPLRDGVRAAAEKWISEH
ncbi:MAG: hypothetical protein ACSHX7_11985 [Luteolibacter sp.]